MGNKKKPPANDLKMTEGAKTKNFPDKRFSDAKRKKEETDHHTVGGF